MPNRRFRIDAEAVDGLLQLAAPHFRIFAGYLRATSAPRGEGASVASTAAPTIPASGSGLAALSLVAPASGGSFAILHDLGAPASGGLFIDVERMAILPGAAGDGRELLSGDGDQLILGGSAPGTRLGGAAAGHEELIFLGGVDHDIVATDDDVAAGENLAVIASALGLGDDVMFDGSAERDGSFAFLGGAGGDTFTGGAGGDSIFGGGGADRLTGGGGADYFTYTEAAQSTGTGFDTLVGFDFGEDRIHFAGGPKGMSAAVRSGSFSQASADADLARAMTGLGADRAVWFIPSAGDMAGRIFLVADGNGVAGYQAGEDYVIEIAAPPPPDLTDNSFFV